MIDMVICTFKRLDKQITLSKIPESYRDNVTLVVQPQEANDAKKIHKNIFILATLFFLINLTFEVLIN